MYINKLQRWENCSLPLSHSLSIPMQAYRSGVKPPIFGSPVSSLLLAPLTLLLSTRREKKNVCNNITMSPTMSKELMRGAVDMRSRLWKMWAHRYIRRHQRMSLSTAEWQSDGLEIGTGYRQHILSHHIHFLPDILPQCLYCASDHCSISGNINTRWQINEQDCFPRLMQNHGRLHSVLKEQKVNIKLLE